MSQKVLLADSEPFRFKERLKDKTNNDGTINGKKVVPLKYLNSLQKAHEMHLTNCENSPISIWAANRFIFEGNRVPNLTITDTKRYVLVAFLSTQGNAKLIQQLESCFKRTTNWNINQK